MRRHHATALPPVASAPSDDDIQARPEDGEPTLPEPEPDEPADGEEPMEPRVGEPPRDRESNGVLDTQESLFADDGAYRVDENEGEGQRLVDPRAARVESDGLHIIGEDEL